MQKIVDILEKLKVDDIILYEKFPIDGSIEDMIEFLKENNFKFIKNVDSVRVLFDSANSKCYTTYKDKIWFADTSKEKISKKNPVFTHVGSKHINTYTVYFINNIGTVEHIVEDDKKAFMEELNKRFGW